MLQNFNPCFVLDLTATPTPESNILCYVDAVQLKRENMVKLPVIVYNRDSQIEVMADAIDLRNRLEEYTKQEQKTSGRYIRPIVLFQAQPKGKEDSTTFEKLREKLVAAGIPAEQIAIKTADVNELKNVDLLRPDCPIRYIITVNALKEGWDCPFAYILASLANKSSQVDVEQIVGRVLRQPYTQQYSAPALNMSYILTSSNNFKDTLDGIVRGLNGAGFSDKDYRVAQEAEERAPASEQTSFQPVQTQFTPAPSQPQPQAKESAEAEFWNFDSDALGQTLQGRQETAVSSKEKTGVDTMLESAQREQETFEAAQTSDENGEDLPSEVKEKMSTFRMNTAFEEEARAMHIPQFFRKIDCSFIAGNSVFLTKETLGESFTLRGKPYEIDFKAANAEMARIDINDDGNTPRAVSATDADQRFMKELFSKYSPEQKIRACKDILHKQLDSMDMIDSSEPQTYIDRIVDDMDRETLSALENSPRIFVEKIKQYIEHLLSEHYEKQFSTWYETGEIICKPSYALPLSITPMKVNTTFGKSLYRGEEDANHFEYEMVMALTGLPNVKWWHRNMAKKGFWINGFVNHYPDFIVRTTNGHTVMIETKGDHLDNDENRAKLAEARAWQNKAGPEYRYYMVFQNKHPGLSGAYPMDQFLDIMRKL